jgi:hypothetical protein
MGNSKTLLVVAVVVALGVLAYKKLSTKSYEPIVFLGETYVHVDGNEVNKVENHMFTSGGVALDETDGFIQISKYDDPDLTPQQVRLVQKQVIKSFGLQAVDGSPNRFFGVFRGTVPVYGFMKDDAFVLKVGPQQAAVDSEALRAASGASIDALSRVPTRF